MNYLTHLIMIKVRRGKGEECFVCEEGENVGEMIFMMMPLQTGINESHN